MDLIAPSKRRFSRLGSFQSRENRGQLHRTYKGLSPRHPSLRPGLHHLQKTRAFQREDTTSHGMTQSILLFPKGEKKKLTSSQAASSVC
jgi:hypothetical protein